MSQMSEAAWGYPDLRIGGGAGVRRPVVLVSIREISPVSESLGRQRRVALRSLMSHPMLTAKGEEQRRLHSLQIHDAEHGILINFTKHVVDR